MRVMVIVKANKDSEAGVMPSDKVMAEMEAFNEQLVKAGIFELGEGLYPSAKGKRVMLTGTRTVIDGPFAETKELIAGFWIWKVKDMNEAIAWARRCPNPEDVDENLELRPIPSMEEFMAATQ